MTFQGYLGGRLPYFVNLCKRKEFPQIFSSVKRKRTTVHEQVCVFQAKLPVLLHMVIQPLVLRFSIQHKLSTGEANSRKTSSTKSFDSCGAHVFGNFQSSSRIGRLQLPVLKSTCYWIEKRHTSIETSTVVVIQFFFAVFIFVLSSKL